MPSHLVVMNHHVQEISSISSIRKSLPPKGVKDGSKNLSKDPKTSYKVNVPFLKKGLLRLGASIDQRINDQPKLVGKKNAPTIQRNILAMPVWSRNSSGRQVSRIILVIFGQSWRLSSFPNGESISLILTPRSQSKSIHSSLEVTR
ncbi:hypothetical protein Tco_0951023 [Tanacetum coccineum]|uniref:Uncharacterized protein n=1 Tax=Tanacetum coccineum TaxID=301880 RepID=A0ABQ5DTT8_9ASTR